jgi:hypothetical protein
MDPSSFPDLEAAVGRLAIIAAHRDAMTQLKESSAFDETFGSCFEEILVSSPRDVALLKAEIATSFRDKQVRTRGRRSIRLLRRQFPELFDLESDWLNSLYRQKAFPLASQARTTSATTSDGAGTTWYWWLVFIVIYAAFKAMRSLNE